MTDKQNLLDDPYYQALKAEYASNATDNQFIIWVEDCKKRGLEPVRDVVLQVRAVKEWDQEAQAKIFKKKAVYITTVQALRKLAERTGKYAGQLPSRWIYLDPDGSPTLESEVPLPEYNSTQMPRRPWAAKASVLRTGFAHPITVPARFEAYAQYFTNNNQQQLNSTWSNRGPEQLEKCAEALALRKAFPEELSGLYLQEEIRDEESVQQTAQATAPEHAEKVSIPAAPVVPAVDHTPAIPTEALRPGETKKRGRPAGSKNVQKTDEPKTDKRTDFEFGANSTGMSSAPSAGATNSPAESEAVPVSDTAPAASENIKEKADKIIATLKPPKTGENIHGVAVTDADLPSNLQPPRKPTAEENKKFQERCMAIKNSGIEGPKIRQFIWKTAGVSNSNDITFQQWEGIMEKFDAAEKEGKLKELVG